MQICDKETKGRNGSSRGGQLPCSLSDQSREPKVYVPQQSPQVAKSINTEPGNCCRYKEIKHQAGGAWETPFWGYWGP